MKILPLLIALLILSFLSLGASVSEVNLFVSDYLGENETFTKIPFNLSDGEYYIINITEPSFILRIPWNGSTAMITDRGEIRNALLGYYALQGVTYDSLKLNKTYSDELLSLLDSYNQTRLKEDECKRYIGIDRFECIDLDTCWRACYTPVCQQLKIGAGRPFLEFIWAFSNSSSYIDSNYSAFDEKLSSLSEFSSLEQIDELILLIDNMKNNSVGINSNDLLNPAVLGFCHLVDYNLTYLTQAEIKLLTTRDTLLPLLTLNDTAEDIYANTIARLSLKAQLKIDRLCLAFISNNSKEFSSIKANFSSLNTSGMRKKLDELKDSMELRGCNEMNESGIQAAQLHYSNLSQQVRAYGEELLEVVKVRDEVESSIAGMKGDLLLYFKTGELASKLSEVNARIDSAEFTQLPALENQLIQLRNEVEDANRNKFTVFLTGFFTSPYVVIILVLLLVAFLISRGRGKLSKK